MDTLEKMMEHEIPEIYQHILNLDVNFFINSYIYHLIKLFITSYKSLHYFVNIFSLLCCTIVLRNLEKES